MLALPPGIYDMQHTFARRCCKDLMVLYTCYIRLSCLNRARDWATSLLLMASDMRHRGGWWSCLLASIIYSAHSRGTVAKTERHWMNATYAHLRLRCAQAWSSIVPASRCAFRTCLGTRLPASASLDHLIFSRLFNLFLSPSLHSSCIADYTALRALHSSLTSTANTAIPPASQTPCAIKTGISFCTRRTARCLSRSSRPPATPCKRAVLPMAMVCPLHPRPRTTFRAQMRMTDKCSQCRL